MMSYQKLPLLILAVLVRRTYTPEQKRLQTLQQNWIRHSPNTEQMCLCGNKETKEENTQH